MFPQAAQENNPYSARVKAFFFEQFVNNCKNIIYSVCEIFDKDPLNV